MFPLPNPSSRRTRTIVCSFFIGFQLLIAVAVYNPHIYRRRVDDYDATYDGEASHTRREWGLTSEDSHTQAHDFHFTHVPYCMYNNLLQQTYVLLAHSLAYQLQLHSTLQVTTLRPSTTVLQLLFSHAIYACHAEQWTGVVRSSCSFPSLVSNFIFSLSFIANLRCDCEITNFTTEHLELEHHNHELCSSCSDYEIFKSPSLYTGLHLFIYHNNITHMVERWTS